jgi:hypothetical protein
LKDRERDGLMNQVSPRVFEAVAARTALILFEGKYSGVVRPDEHYIPLKKDFSNVEEVLNKVQDEAYLERMIERAHQHVIGSGLYSYQHFVEGVDQVLSERAPGRAGGESSSLASCLATKACQTGLDVWTDPPTYGYKLWLPWVTGLVWESYPVRWVRVRRQQVRAANLMMPKGDPLSAIWNEVRGVPANRPTFGSMLACYKEFVLLALLRSTYRRTFLLTVPWTIVPHYDAATGCLRFTSQSFFRLEPEPGPEAILAACAAIRAGSLKQVVWEHGAQGSLFQFPFPAGGERVYFFLSDSGTIRFSGLERLAGVNPELAIRLLQQVSGTDQPQAVQSIAA